MAVAWEFLDTSNRLNPSKPPTDRFRFRCGHVLVALRTLVKNEVLRPDLVHAKLLELTMDMIAVAEAR